MSASQRRRMQDPEELAKARERMSRVAQDPLTKYLIGSAKEGYVHSAQTRAKMSESHRRNWQDPEWRAKRLERAAAKNQARSLPAPKSNPERNWRRTHFREFKWGKALVDD